MAYQVFISYRRDGGESLAQLISNKLTAKGIKTFYDVESMRSGDFNEQIYEVIDSCKDVIVVLPPNGLDRCVNENDWVRKEIAYAIKKKKNIVSLMMRDFEFPENLPEDIEKIKNLHAIRAHMDLFDASFDKLFSLLKSRYTRKIRVCFSIFIALIVAVFGVCGLARYFEKNNANFTEEDNIQPTSVVDTIAPVVTISDPSFDVGTVESGKLEFTVHIEENTEFFAVKINDDLVETIGFTAEMEVVDQRDTQILRFTKLKKTADECYIVLHEGVVKDAANNKSGVCRSRNFYFNTNRPTMTIGPKEKNKIVKEGDTAVYNVAVYDDDMVWAALRKSDIKMYGFIADITIKKKDVENADAVVWEVTFSNIKFDSSSSDKYFEISEGVIADFYGNINHPRSLPIIIK